jgi:hypothetical protein
VPALAIGLRAVGDLHHERDLLARHPRQHPRLEDGAQVVGVRDERVAVAALEQRVEHPGRQQRRVEVAVAGWAPLQRRVGRPLDRRQVVGEELRLLVLDEVRRHVGARLGVERLQRVVVRGERVHQHERQPRARPAAQLEHLARDHVEEAHPVLRLDQRLRARHAHARTEPAVELDHHRLVQRRLPRWQPVELLRILDRLDLGLRDHPRLALGQLPVVVLEGGDRGLREPLPPHLLHAGLQPVHGSAA